MKKLSIIIPAYNAENYIDRCIHSILSQDVDAEILVIDDGSTDRTREILEAYKGKLKLLLLGENGGCAGAARNAGLDQASGDLITFCDADDWYMPGALSKILELQRKTDADIVRFSYVRVFPDGREKPPIGETFQDGMIRKGQFCQKVYPYFIEGIALNSVWASCFKRSVVEHVRFSTTLQTGEDAAYAMEAYTKADSIFFCSEPLYCYYQHKDSLTGTGLGIFEKYRCNFSLAARTLDYLPKWGMDTICWKIKTVLRPLKLTIEKIGRLKNK